MKKLIFILVLMLSPLILFGQHKYFKSVTVTDSASIDTAAVINRLNIDYLKTPNTIVVTVDSNGDADSLETVLSSEITYDTTKADFVDVTNNIDVGDTLGFDNGFKIYNTHADTGYIEETVLKLPGILVTEGQTKARGGITIGDESGTGTDITKIDSVTMVDSKYAFFHGADTTAPYTPVADQVVIGETAHLLEDTVSVFTFGAGMEIAGDTALFNDGSEFGSFYHLKDTFIVTNLVTALSSGDTLDFYIVWDELPDTGGDTLVNAGSSIDGGHTAISSFDDTKIPPGRHVWCDQKSTTHGRNPIKFRATLLGYLKRD